MTQPRNEVVLNKISKKEVDSRIPIKKVKDSRSQLMRRKNGQNLTEIFSGAIPKQHKVRDYQDQVSGSHIMRKSLDSYKST